MFSHIVLGGTFDGLHKGHKHFLTQAFSSARRATIGLTSQTYIRQYKKGKTVSPYSKRYQALAMWLRQNHFAERAIVVPIDYPLGPAVIGDFDAIAVTPDNRRNADIINRLRFERNLPNLSVIEIEILKASDAQPISSSRVRTGIIDTEGRLVMPDFLRPELHKPLGNIIANEDIKHTILTRTYVKTTLGVLPLVSPNATHKGNPGGWGSPPRVTHAFSPTIMDFEKNSHCDYKIITIGDVATQKFMDLHVTPSLSIIDLHVQRKPFKTVEEFGFPDWARFQYIVSGPGYISRDAIDAIRQWGINLPRGLTILVIDGEEDLLAIPAIIHAPPGSFVYYGQPNKGLVEVEVTMEKKEGVRNLLKQFS